MDNVWEDLRISVVDNFQQLVAALSPQHEDDSDDETGIGRKVKVAKSQLQLLKLQGRESRSNRRQERKKLAHELYEQQRNLHRLGKKAQRHVSLYDYAVLMRDMGPTFASGKDTETTERLLGKRPEGLEVPSSTDSHHANNNHNATNQQQQQPIGTTLILRSQTFYGSSAYLWQLMVQSVLQVRLLQKCHLLTMIKAQEAIFKARWSEDVEALALYVKSKEKMDEACLDLMQRKALLWSQMEDIKRETVALQNAYTEIMSKQRRIILKLKLREGQAVSGRVKEGIEQRRSSLSSSVSSELNATSEQRRQSTLKQEIDNSPVPFLAELKRESLKRLSTIKERLSQDMDGPLVEQVRMEFSVDEKLLEEEEEAAVAAAKRSLDVYAAAGRISPSQQSQDMSSGGLNSSSRSQKAFGSNVSLSMEHIPHNDAASYISSSTISDDSFLDLNHTEIVSPGTQTKQKRTKAELKKSLDTLAQLNSSQRSVASGGDNCSIRSSASRAEMEHRRLQAEQRLARSKRASKRISMQAQRQKAKRRLEESKKRLRGFLATDDDDGSDSISFSGREGDDPGIIHPFSSFQEGESSTSLRSPDNVANFPYGSSTSLPTGTGN